MRLRRALVTFAVLAALYGLAAQIGGRYLPRRIWWTVHYIDDVELLPTYRSLLDETLFLVRSGTLPRAVMVSTTRVLAGLLLGSIVGVPVGAAMAGASRVDAVLTPWVTLFRYTPALGLLPLYVLWFGVGEVSKVLLIATAVGGVMVVGTYQAVRLIPRIHLEAAALLGAPGGMIMRRVAMPAMLPHIVASLRIAVGLAWVTVVAAELINPTMPSLGYLLTLAAAFPRVPTIIVGIGTIGGLVLLSDAVAIGLYDASTRWMKRRGDD